MIKNLLIIIAICLVNLIFSSGDKEAYTFLEVAIPSILGAIFGGITAGITIIFSVLLTVATSVNTSININLFRTFLDSLKIDMFVLLFCLIASLLLPYFRVAGIPYFYYPEMPYIPERDVFYTSLELTAITVAVAVIVEIFRVIFNLFEHYASVLSKEAKKGS